MNRKILFVDDSREILEGLRVMLRRQRHEWDMTFVESGRMALRVLQAAPHDVIVSDIRMPEMDGCTLLTNLRPQRAPALLQRLRNVID